MDINTISNTIERCLTPAMPVIEKLIPYEKIVYGVIGVGTVASLIRRLVAGYGFLSALFTPLLFAAGIFCLFYPLCKKYKEQTRYTDRVEAVVASVGSNGPVYEYTFEGRTYRASSKNGSKVHLNTGDRTTLFITASDPTDIYETDCEDGFTQGMLLGGVASLIAGLLFWLISLIAH